jgi:hypothetical protein
MNESQIDKEQVRREHLASVDQRKHWVYLVAVLGGGCALMLVLIAALGGGSG